MIKIKILYNCLSLLKSLGYRYRMKAINSDDIKIAGELFAYLIR